MVGTLMSYTDCNIFHCLNISSNVGTQIKTLSLYHTTNRQTEWDINLKHSLLSVWSAVLQLKKVFLQLYCKPSADWIERIIGFIVVTCGCGCFNFERHNRMLVAQFPANLTAACPRTHQQTPEPSLCAWRRSRRIMECHPRENVKKSQFERP